MMSDERALVGFKAFLDDICGIPAKLYPDNAEAQDVYEWSPADPEDEALIQVIKVAMSLRSVVFGE